MFNPKNRSINDIASEVNAPALKKMSTKVRKENKKQHEIEKPKHPTCMVQSFFLIPKWSFFVLADKASSNLL